MEAAARPVRKPPSSCLRACVAPCMRRFNSLMSNLSVGITLFPPEWLSPRPPGLRAVPSAGDDRAVARAAQDRADRTRLGDREHDDRQRRLAGKRECGRIHDLVAAFNRL